MSIAGKLFGGLVPTITFQGQSASVKSIDFQINYAEITLVTSDGSTIALTVDTKNARRIS